MYIKEFQIKKFRSIDSLTLHFNKGLNVIIGENNSGKSTVIDALRICLGSGRLYRDITIRNDEDFFIDINDPDSALYPIEFALKFEIEIPEDRELFNSLMWQNPDDTTDVELRLNFRYSLEPNAKDNLVLRYKIWGGGEEDRTVDHNELQNIFYTYLAPLRDAEQELRPYAKGNKITSLFREMTKYKRQNGETTEEKSLDDDHKMELANKLEAVIKDDDWSGLINTGQEFVNDHLEQADISNKSAKVDVGLIEYRYENIVKGVITRKKVFQDKLIEEDPSKQRYFDISQNGLGENNLIYASAVLGDVENRRKEGKEHYYAMLLEEPEAHLHPQKQNTFFNHLNSLQDFGMQLFISSHSPTITAKTDLDTIITLQRQNNLISSFSTIHSELTPKNKSYLRKFLDVTKSQLFFSNGVILVEGISESIMLPVFAKKMGAKYDLDKNGIEVVNINGVAFEPFANLFNSPDSSKRLSSKCSILTDDDSGLISSNDFLSSDEGINRSMAKKIVLAMRNEAIIDSTNRVEFGIEPKHFQPEGFEDHFDFIQSQILYKMSTPSSRASGAIKLGGENLKIFLASITFEFELLSEDPNLDLIIDLYRLMHPKTDFLPNTANDDERAREILVKLDSFKDKSELAQNIVFELENNADWSEFIIPEYIQNAIKWASKQS